MSSYPIPDAALEQHLAILGKTGSGKSNAAKTLAEILMQRGERVCAIDPTGTWWGLRLRADGKKPSQFKPVIFGGAHGDLAIAGAHGAAIGEAIATASTSAIVDTRQLSVRDRMRFFTEFAEALLRTNRGTLYLMIDEAHLFAPQAGAKVGPEAAAMLHAANNLVSLGRGVGLRIVLISQRPAKLHKDSLTQVETLVAMRLGHPLDRKAVDDWIGDVVGDPARGREIVASLPRLLTGDAWVWSPGIDFLERRSFPLVATYDSGRPRAEIAIAPLAPIDIDAVAGRLERIGKAVLENDPARLRKRIADLERTAAKPAPAGVDEAAIAAAEARGRAVLDEAIARARAQAQAYGELAVAVFDEIAAAFGTVTRTFEKVLGDARVRLLTYKSTAAAPDTARSLGRRTAPRVAAAPPPEESPEIMRTIDASVVPGQLPPARRKILVALRQAEAMGQKTPERTNLSLLAGVSPSSSTFANNLGALRTAGLIDYPGGGTVALTEAGKAAVPPVEAPTHQEILALVAGLVAPAVMRMLLAAVDAFPGELTTEELATAVGASPTSSTFANNRGRLKSLGLITYPRAGAVRAAEVLFP